MKVDRKTQVIGLNRYLADIYLQDLRISQLLIDLGFSNGEIEDLRSEHMGSLLDQWLDAIKDQFESGHDGQRLFKVVCRRYGLDGYAPSTLQQLGSELQVSRERVRQLEKKAIKRRSNSKQRKRLEENLSEIAAKCLAA